MVGDVPVLVKDVGSNRDEVSTVRGAIHTPTEPDNLLSSHLLEEDGWEMIFIHEAGEHFCCLEKDTVRLRLDKERGRYRLRAAPAEFRDVCAVSQAANPNENELQRWHTRFAHLNVSALGQMVSQKTAFGMENLCGAENSADRREQCWTCTAAKLKRMAYKRTLTRRATEPYQKLMSDMCYMGVYTYDGYQHSQLVQDEATRYMWEFLMKAKEEATDVVSSHVKWLCAQDHRIEVISTDQGKELVNERVKAFLRERGVEFIWTNSYSPEENWLVERMNGILLARVRCLLTTVHMLDYLWGEAFGFVAEVANISLTSALGGETPYTRQFGERPNVDEPRIWAHNPSGLGPTSATSITNYE